MLETGTSKVAISEIVRKRSLSQDHAKRLRNEVAVLNTIYPGRVIQTGVNNANFYFDQKNLGSPSTSAAPLSANSLISVAYELAIEFEFINSCGYLHRDIKPQNILLDRLRPIVIDFGSAIPIGEAMESSSNFVYSSPSFTPPEIHLRQGDWTVASDVFSFGVTLYYLASGKLPFDERVPDCTVDAICYDQPQEIPTDLWGVIKNCLQKNPADRYQSFIHVAGDIEKVVRGHSVEDMSPSKRVLATRKLKQNIPLIFCSILLLFLSFLGYRHYTLADKLYIAFDHEVPCAEVVLRNEQREYNISGDDGCYVEPGIYETIFTSKSGERTATVRYIPEKDLHSMSFVEPFFLAKKVWGYSVPGLKEKTGEFIPRTVFSKISGKERQSKEFYYFPATYMLEKTTMRMPTLVELEMAGLNGEDYLYVEKASFETKGKLYPVPRTGINRVFSNCKESSIESQL